MKIKRFPLVASALLVTGLMLPGSLEAESSKDAEDPISSDTEKAYNNLESDADVQQAMQFIKSDDDNTLEQQIELTEIPAPPHKEDEKAAYFKDELNDLGLEDVHIDDKGNVISTRPGIGDGPTLAIAAHLDIAFGEGVDTTVTEKDGILYAPGIGDDNRGLAALLSVVRALNEEDITTEGDIMFVGTVGEEDDFRGAQAFLDEHDDIDGFISVDGNDPSTIKHGGTAGATIEFNYQAPGGHAFGDFQTPSATHALGRATSQIADLGKTDPKTTFNVGTMEGGTRENAKAEEASMLTEFRTDDGENADKMKQTLIDAAEDGAKKENERWDKTSDEGVTVEHDTKIDIPGGEWPKDEMIVQAATASTDVIELEPEFTTSGMTDSNFSHGADIPGINIGAGGEGGKAHSLDEWYDPTDAYLGPQKIFMTTLGLVGMDGVSEPLLASQDGDADVSIESLKELVDQFAGDDKIDDEQVVHQLNRHLTVVGHFAQDDAIEKAEKHMKGFQSLIEQYEKKGSMEESAAEELIEQADQLIGEW